MTYIPLPVLKLSLLIFDVAFFWTRYIADKLWNSTERTLIYRLNHASSLSEYTKTAFSLDNLFHNDVWKDNLISSKYDYRLIQERLHDLQYARSTNDYSRLLSLLRAGILRNFGGISNKNLYNRTYIGTKILIEQYNHEVENCLKYIDSNLFLDNQKKLDFYHDAKTTLGTTALCLHGGSLFGLCHIGVLKGLIECRLLPQVIVGSGVGSIVGALVSCLDELDMHLVLADTKGAMKTDGFELNAAHESKKDSQEQYLKWIENFKKGLTVELTLFFRFVLNKIGDITFKEAFEKTGRVFNVLVYPTANNVPTLLNYLNTPYITIKSAIICSMGTGIMENCIAEPAKLMMNYNGKRPYTKIECDFKPPFQVSDGSMYLQVSPYNRITELFNVNHFVISVSRPYLAPHFLGNWRIIYKNRTFLKKLLSLINLEFKHRIRILNAYGLLSPTMRWLFVDEKFALMDTNNVSIIPVGNNWIGWDIYNMFNQDHSVMNYWIGCGQRSIYATRSLLETRIRMECLLEKYYEKYRMIN